MQVQKSNSIPKGYRYSLISIWVMAFFLVGCGTKVSYLGQEPPSDTPVLFAPTIVNTESIEINSVFNSRFTELFFTRIMDGRFVIHHSELVNGVWSSPKPIEMYADRKRESVAIDPSVTQDGKTMYFLGISPEDRAKNAKPDIYKSEKINGKWQIATKVGYPISTDEYAESYPVVVADGSLYFTSDRPGGLGKRDIYRAQYLGDGRFDTPVNLGQKVNSVVSQRSTYVAPDESFLITGDTYINKKGFAISFREDDTWQTPVSYDFGEALTKDWIYFCPYMSPDGKYFFFSKRLSDPSNSGWKGVIKGEVYWVEASVIYSLKEKQF
ncbi:hypothetical protein ACOKFD_14780 [Flagellimonas sp. S174]|uniref:hypothetical protein n=1 Tax=Flagellimonas sp. S174 TaxID=3410790 RepID=UPI003BF51CD1